MFFRTTIFTLLVLLGTRAAALDLYTAGDGSRGQLADGTQHESLSWTAGLENIDSVSFGTRHALYLLKDHSLWAAGNNDYGQLGDGTLEGRLSPVHVSDDVIACSAGGTHSLFLKSDHTLWGMGNNRSAQLGMLGFEFSPIPFKIADDVRGLSALDECSLWVKGDTGTLELHGILAKPFGLGDYGASAVLAQGVTGLSGHCFLKGNDLFEAFVSNRKPSSIWLASLSTNQIASDVTAFSGSKNSVAYISKDHSLRVSPSATLHIEQGFTASPSNVATPPVDTGVQSVSTSDTHQLYIREDGTVWALGENKDGQFGNGSTANAPSPVQVAPSGTAVFAGPAQSLFIDSTGKGFSSGANPFGQFANGRATSRQVARKAASGVAQVSAGVSNLMILLTDGTLQASGANDFGELGDGTTTSRNTPVGIATHVSWVASGDHHTLFIKEDGSLWGCGDNQKGQLGDGTTLSRPTPFTIATGVSKAWAGPAHTLFLKTDGTLWGMGSNEAGQLGDGTATNRLAPVQIASQVTDCATGDVTTLYLTGTTAWATGDVSKWFTLSTDTIWLNRPVKLVDNAVKIAASGEDAALLDANQILWFGGSMIRSYSTGDNKPVCIDEGISNFFLARKHVFTVRAHGETLAFGENTFGELAQGNARTSLEVPLWRHLSLPYQPSAIVSGEAFSAFLLEPSPAPQFTVEPSSQAVPLGSPLVLKAACTGATSVTWLKDGSPLVASATVAIDGTRVAFSHFDAADVGNYELEANNESGTVRSAKATLSAAPAAGDLHYRVEGSWWSTKIGIIQPLLQSPNLKQVGMDLVEAGGGLWVLSGPLAFLAEVHAFSGDKSGYVGADGVPRTAALSLEYAYGSKSAYQLNAPLWQGLNPALHGIKKIYSDGSSSNQMVLKQDGTLWARTYTFGNSEADENGVIANPLRQIADNVADFIQTGYSGVGLLRPDGSLAALDFSAALLTEVDTGVEKLVPGSSGGLGLAGDITYIKRDKTCLHAEPSLDNSGAAPAYGYTSTVLATDIADATRINSSTHLLKTDGSLWVANTFINQLFNQAQGTSLETPVKIADHVTHLGRNSDDVYFTRSTPAPAPTWSFSPGNLAVIDGESATFTSYAVNATHYQWYHGEVAIPDAVRTILTLTQATQGDDGSYHVVASNESGETRSPDFTLSLLPALPKLQENLPSLTQPSGSTATLNAYVHGPGLSFQWYHNGEAIPGAQGDSYSITSIQESDAGDYTFVATNIWGSVTSRAATLTVATPTASRLINLSTRAVAGHFGSPLIVGFVANEGSRQVLVRAAGPSLSPFLDSGWLPDPALEVHQRVDGVDTLVNANEDWGTGATSAETLAQLFSTLGAFPFTTTSSLDAAVVSSATGPTTAIVLPRGIDNEGIALVEIYDAENSPDKRLKNVSARNFVGEGANALVVGFVTRGSEPKNLLIRGVGPGLSPFSITNGISDPTLSLYRSQGDLEPKLLASNNDYESEPLASAWAAQVGAFNLAVGSKDSALVVSLPEGAYTVILSNQGNTGEIGLVEVYDLDPK